MNWCKVTDANNWSHTRILSRSLRGVKVDLDHDRRKHLLINGLQNAGTVD